MLGPPGSARVLLVDLAPWEAAGVAQGGAGHLGTPADFLAEGASRWQCLSCSLPLRQSRRTGGARCVRRSWLCYCQVPVSVRPGSELSGCFPGASAGLSQLQLWAVIPSLLQGAHTSSAPSRVAKSVPLSSRGERPHKVDCVTGPARSSCPAAQRLPAFGTAAVGAVSWQALVLTSDTDLLRDPEARGLLARCGQWGTQLCVPDGARTGPRSQHRRLPGEPRVRRD